MKPETPAKGILKMNHWGPSCMYKIVCGCGQDDCSHIIDIESDDTGVAVTIYTTQKTNFWSWNGLMTRLKLTWQLWTKGYVEYQGSLMMDEQVALNYADTLKSAMEDVKDFRKEGF